MKLVFILSIVVFSMYFIGTEASLIRRQKRATAMEHCPENSSPKKCKDYAKKSLQRQKSCQTYSISESTIHWYSCGSVACGENLKLSDYDLSKPYPKCCQTCVPA